MSSIAFGALARKRQEAPANKSTDDAPPGLRSYIDTLAALVPAEVLAMHTAVMHSTTKTTKGPHGKDVVTITNPDLLTWAFRAMILASVVFYVAGFQKKRWTRPAFFGAFIPPIAFVLWTMAQNPSAFNAEAPSIPIDTREVIVALATPFVALAATFIPIILNNKPAKK
jgi:hypothetical protein